MKGVTPLAERRMFSKTITNSDKFFSLSLSAQALYFHLAMSADDDGFVNNSKVIQRLIGASNDDFNLLVLNKFILKFDSGIVAITHWKIHNCIQKDRYKETIYVEEKSMLRLTENKEYAEWIQNGSKMDPKWIQNGSKKEKEKGHNKNIKEKEKEDNKNRKEKEYKEKEKTFSRTCEQIIDYLNSSLSTQYKAKNKQTQQLIKERLDEGFTFNDFKTVIDKKNKEWRNSEMAEFLRPLTLFGKNFESYLNTPTKTAHSQNNGLRAYERNYNQNDYEKLITNIKDIKF